MRGRVIPALLGLACTASAVQIKTSRPRLLVDAARVRQLQSRAADPKFAPLKTALQDYVLRYGSHRDPDTAQFVMPILALMALSEGSAAVPLQQESWGQWACSYTAAYIAANPQPTYWSGNFIRWNLQYIPMVYDWAYSYCTPAQRSVMQARMEAYLATLRSNYYTSYKDTPGVYGNLFLSALNAAVKCWIALHDPARGSDRNAALTEALNTRLLARVLPAVTASTAVAPYEGDYGGQGHEGFEYDCESAYMLAESLNAFEYGTDTNIHSRFRAWWDNVLEVWLLGPSPAPWTTIGRPLYFPLLWRDSQPYAAFAKRFSALDRHAVELMADHYRRHGDAKRASWAQWWLNHIAPAYLLANTTPYTRDSWPDWLYDDPDAQEMQPALTDHVTPFSIVSKSDSTAGATWTGIYSGPSQYGDHNHGDSGGFFFYRKGQWLTFEEYGYPGSWPDSTAATGRAHNTLILNWHDTGLFRNSHPPAIYPRAARTPSGYAAVCDPSYCYAELDLTGGYSTAATDFGSSADVQMVKRTYLYLKPDLVVIADRVRYQPGVSAATGEWLQAGTVAPAIHGNVITHIAGDQKLTATIVAPAAPLVRAFSNEDPATVIGAEKIDDNTVYVHLSQFHQYANGGRFTISGAAGEWAAINGTWQIALPPMRTAARPGAAYLDGPWYNRSRVVISGNGAFRRITRRWDLSQSGVPRVALSLAVSMVSKSGSDAIVFTTSSPHGLDGGAGLAMAVRLEGFSAPWNVLNGKTCRIGVMNATMFQCSTVGEFSQVSGIYPANRIMTLPWAGVAFETNATGAIERRTYYASLILYPGYTTPGGEEAGLMTLQGSDASAVPPAVGSGSTPSVLAAQIGNTVVAIPRTLSVPRQISYRFQPRPGVTHYILGLGSGAAYIATEENGTITIRRAERAEKGAIAAGASGMLIYPVRRTGQ